MFARVLHVLVSQLTESNVSDPACLDFDKRKSGYSSSDRFLARIHESIAHPCCEHLG